MKHNWFSLGNSANNTSQQNLKVVNVWNIIYKFSRSISAKLSVTFSMKYYF